MSLQKIKKAAKLLALSLIISVITFPTYSYCQTDTAKLRKELNILLKKYGLKDATFLLKVESLNQKGGQTAFEINNYNLNQSHVVYGNNYGVNGNVSSERQFDQQDQIQLIQIIEKLKKDSLINPTMFGILYRPGSNGSKYGQQLANFLKSRGFIDSGINGTAFGEPIAGAMITLQRNGLNNPAQLLFVIGTF